MPWKRGIVLIPTQDTTYQAFDMHLAIGQMTKISCTDGRGTNPHRMFSCLHSWYGGYQVATVEGPRYDGGYQVASRGIARVEGLGGGASKDLEYNAMTATGTKIRFTLQDLVQKTLDGLYISTS